MNASSCTILYVEPEDLTRRTVCRRFRRRGFAVLEATSLATARTRIGSGQGFDVVLLEPAINCSSGLLILPELRQVRTVICTSAAEEFPVVRLRSEGISEDGCLYKPCGFQKLLTAIGNALSRSS